jgi:hypothetical protein
VWEEIERRVLDDGYMQGVERSKERVGLTAEVFTPGGLVVDMLKRMPDEAFEPGMSVLDPACGDGNFLVAAKWLKVFRFGMSEEDALTDLYGVDVMRDNVDRAKKRLGGGTIVMGDTLKPDRRLPGQTAHEHEVMRELFVVADQRMLF